MIFLKFVVNLEFLEDFVLNVSYSLFLVDLIVGGSLFL